jgi:hypothetical protein
MINRAITGDRGQAGNIPPVCCGQDISHKAGQAREAHPLYTPPLSLCLLYAHRGGIGTRLKTKVLVKPTQTL